MNFDEVIQLQVLKLKAQVQGTSSGLLVDIAIAPGTVEARQMCAKVSPELIERLDAVTSALDMSKREFIEAAVSDAVIRAEQALKRSGVFDQGSL